MFEEIRKGGPVGRIAALDRFRGLAIALMIAFGAAKMFVDTDFFVQLSSHDVAESFQLIVGFGFYDVIAPLFVFASGLSFWASYLVSVKKIGATEAKKKSVVHALEVVGMGGLVLFDFSSVVGIVCFCFMPVALVLFILSFAWEKKRKLFRKILQVFLVSFGVVLLVLNAVETILSAFLYEVPSGQWGALPSIGLGMLLCVAIVDLPKLKKVAFCFSGIVFLTALHGAIDERFFTAFTHGGILGGLGYALLFLLAYTLLSLKDEPYFYFAFVLCLTLCAGVCSWFGPCSKAAVNVPYILVSFVISASVYAVFTATEGLPIKFFALTTLGKNALTAYCLHFAMSFTYGICLNALVAYLPIKGAIQIILYALGMILYVYIMAFVLRALNKKGWIVKLS